MKNYNFFKIKPYKYGIQPVFKNTIKINTNENPYPPSIKLIKNVINEIKFLGNLLKFYPDTSSYETIKSISNYYKIKTNQIFISNGSDEVLAHSFIGFFKKNNLLYINDITYSFYESYIKLYKINYKIIELNKKFSIKINRFRNNIGNIILTNPNAPTGKYISELIIEKLILENLLSIIIIDEAYIDFGNKSFINLINKYNNLLIIQTTSKSRSLAGIRVGVAIGEFNLIKTLNEIKNSFNSYPVNKLSQIIVKYVYNNNMYFIKNKRNLLKNKFLLFNLLKKLNFNILNSKSNFILIKHKNIKINNLIKYLNINFIYIRKFEIPKIENYARISISDEKDHILFYKLINNKL